MLYEWRAASLGDGRDALLGGRVHKVDGCVRVLRQSNDVAKRQVLGEVVVNKVEVVALRASLALERLSHVGDDVVLFRVHRHDAAVPRDLAKDAPQVTVRNTDRPEGREDLEARGAVLDRLADLPHRLRCGLARQNVVKGEVRIGMTAEDDLAGRFRSAPSALGLFLFIPLGSQLPAVRRTMPI